MLERKWGFRKLWTLVVLLVILHIIIFDLVILTSDDSLQVQYTPDDAYYYLTLAKNFSNLGLWTFDSGLSLTSGFHPLWAYLLSAVYGMIRPSLGVFVQYGVIISSLVTVISLLVAWKFGLNFKKPYYMLLLALIASSRNFVYNSISVVEWPLVVLFSLLYCIQYWRSSTLNKPGHNAIVLAILGLAGSLSRTDFGLLPLFLFASDFFSPRRSRIRVITSFWGLLGTMSGVLLTFIHNFLFTGDYLQSSARMKTYCAQIYGNNYFGVVGLLRAILGLDSIDLRLIVIVLGTVSLFLFVIGVAKQGREKRLRFDGTSYKWSLSIAAILTVIAYGLFYLRNASLQPWYSANLIIPVFLILLSISICVEKLFGRLSTSAILSGFAMVIIVINSISLYPIETTNSRWPHQSAMLEAGKYLAEQELDGIIGSWNAGIIGYYQGGSVVNLDGLVNNDVYEYAIGNDLPSYISFKGIRYIVDFENMYDDEGRRLCGGYDDWNFISSLRAVEVFDNGEYWWKHLTLYELISQ